jgi:hypothetical protein
MLVFQDCKDKNIFLIRKPAGKVFLTGEIFKISNYVQNDQKQKNCNRKEIKEAAG